MMREERRIETSEEQRLVDDLVARARVAQTAFETKATQARYDSAALAAAWALMQPERNAAFSERAVATTGLGKVADKIIKNHRKTLGLLHDIRGVKTCGVIRDDPAHGLTEIARPKGVIGAVVPSTNPLATPTNNVVNALKCGNAIILSPSPRGVEVCAELVDAMHTELAKVGAPQDLVQMIPPPVSKTKAQRLMKAVDLLVVTGSRNNVQRAYASGTPAIGVGVGNVAVIVDETANLADAAAKITASKTFDNATSCSSENALVIVDAVYEAFLAALNAEGGRLLGEHDAAKLKKALFLDNGLNRHIIAQDVGKVLETADITLKEADTTRFLLIEGEGIGVAYPESGEKLSLVATIYRARDFDHAQKLANALLTHQGAGHSVGLHSKNAQRALTLGLNLPSCRVIVNQAHCFATGGAFDNALPFSLSMGCGSWGGNSIDENFHYKHLLNITKIVRRTTPSEPTLEEIFGDYWQRVGQ